MSPSVAIFGLNGALGAATLAAIEASKDKFSLPILAVTRDASSRTSTDTIKYVEGDFVKDTAGVIEKIGSVDVIVSLVQAVPELFEALDKIVTQIKPKLYIPSQFGIDNVRAQDVIPNFLPLKVDTSAALRKKGIKVVEIFNGFFVGNGFLTDILFHIGANTQTKKVTYLGSPDSKLSYTFLEDVGEVIAAVAARNPADTPDVLRVQSGVITPAQIVAKYEQTHGVKFDVESIVPQEQVLAEAKKKYAAGFDPSLFLYYLNVFVSQEDKHSVYFPENDNDVVNPGESLWKWHKY